MAVSFHWGPWSLILYSALSKLASDLKEICSQNFGFSLSGYMPSQGGFFCCIIYYFIPICFVIFIISFPIMLWWLALLRLVSLAIDLFMFSLFSVEFWEGRGTKCMGSISHLELDVSLKRFFKVLFDTVFTLLYIKL